MKLRRAIGWAAMGLSLVGAGVLGAIRDYRYGGDLVWASGYETGRAMALAAHRPMLISFHFSGCDACRKMDAETFTDPRVVALSHDYVCLRVDALRDPDLIQSFHINEFPATVIASADGKTLTQLNGYSDAATIAHALQHNAVVPN